MRWVLGTARFFYYCRSPAVPVDARFLCEKAAVPIAAMKETPCTVNYHRMLYVDLSMAYMVYLTDGRFEVLTALLTFQIFWDVTPCRKAYSYRRFEGSRSFPLQRA